MNWMTYYLCKNPEIKARVIGELESMFPDNLDGATPIPLTKLNKLSLLEYAMIECLRPAPPIGYSMPRDMPRHGAVICGTYVPGGVVVGVPVASIGRHPGVYPDPDKWDPDRWSAEKADLSTMKVEFPGLRIWEQAVHWAERCDPIRYEDDGHCVAAV